MTFSKSGSDWRVSFRHPRPKAPKQGALADLLRCGNLAHKKRTQNKNKQVKVEEAEGSESEELPDDDELLEDCYCYYDYCTTTSTTSTTTTAITNTTTSCRKPWRTCKKNSIWRMRQMSPRSKFTKLKPNKRSFGSIKRSLMLMRRSVRKVSAVRYGPGGCQGRWHFFFHCILVNANVGQMRFRKAVFTTHKLACRNCAGMLPLKLQIQCQSPKNCCAEPERHSLPKYRSSSWKAVCAVHGKTCQKLVGQKGRSTQEMLEHLGAWLCKAHDESAEAHLASRPM